MSLQFRFKQFSLEQDRCAMKVGTDGVLLGAWTSLDHDPESIMDIGSGSGLMALQLAQRSDAPMIDAVEIDHDAFEQCVANFEASPWSDRLFCYHASIQEYASEIEEEYDLIICNPPFFDQDVRSTDPKRDLARFEDALPLKHLMICALHLLSAEGRLSIVIPKEKEEEALALAAELDLFPRRLCRVQGSPNSPIKRVMLEFGLEQTPIQEQLLMLRNEDGSWTDEYVNLVDEFYLDIRNSH